MELVGAQQDGYLGLLTCILKVVEMINFIIHVF